MKKKKVGEKISKLERKINKMKFVASYFVIQ